MRLLIVITLSALVGIAATLLILWGSEGFQMGMETWRWLIDWLKNLSP